MDISMTVTEDAVSLLEDASFLDEWERLYRACPWSTCYQTATFIKVWYEVYRDQYQPVIVRAQSDTAGLVGLLFLARSPDGKNWVVAGKGWAYYLTWIATAECADQFIQTALPLLFKNFSMRELSFVYLAPQTPIHWLHTGARFKLRCVVMRRYRLLLDGCASSAILRSLKKKYKDKLRRLKRAGPPRFAVVTDIEEFMRLLEAIAVHTDLRKAATYDELPFSSNAKLKVLLLALFKAGLLYVTALWSGDGLVAADISMSGRDGVQHGHILSYAPSFARCSPGNLHVLMLAESWFQNGGQTLDFCPGWSWKDEFVNRSEEVYKLYFYAGTLAFIRSQLVELTKRVLRLGGLTHEKIQRFAAHVKHITACWINELEPHYLYAWQKKALVAARPAEATDIGKNRIADLLLYDPRSSHLSRQSFIYLAMRLLGNGSQLYTYTRNNVLIYAAWVTSKPGAIIHLGKLQCFPLPEGAIAIHQLYGNAKVPGALSYTDFLHYVAYSQMAQPDTGEKIYMTLPRKAKAGRIAIEQLGFRLQPLGCTLSRGCSVLAD